MSAPSPGDVTRLLLAWKGGDEAALDDLMPLVHDELHRLARRYMRGERPGNTLQSSDLVNEAYLKLVDSARVGWQNRAHFFAVSAQLMRRILVDHARARGRQKRGGDAWRVTFDEALTVCDEPRHELVALDDALTSLARSDERKARVVELRFFGGLTVDETAAVVQVSRETVLRDWRFAKAWLLRELGRSDGADAPS